MQLDVFFNTVMSSSFFWWGIGLSVLTVLLFVPGTVLVLLHIPPDFLQRDRKTLVERFRKSGWLWGSILVMKNVLAVVFLIAGVLMLFIPGQGVLAILAGLILLDFPGKQSLERWIITQKTVLPTVNWLRRRFGQDELNVVEDSESV